MPKLLLKHEGVTLNTYDLNKDTITIGRKSDNDIQLNDAVASSHHAKITITPNAYMEGQLDAQLTDLSSTNGTQVNNCIINSIELRNGDVVQIGSHHFIYESDDATGMESTAIFLPDEDH